MALALVALVLFYAMAWHRHGRDPQRGIIIPRFYPPKDLSPAAMCYVVNESSNHKNVTAALINLAVKGFVTIEKIARGYRISTKPDSTATPAALSDGENVIMRELWANQTMMLVSDSYDERLVDVKSNLKRQLKKEYQAKCFKDNRVLGYMGILISVFVMMFYLIEQNAFTLEVLTLLFILAAVLGLIVYFVNEPLHRKAKWGKVAIATFVLVMLVAYYKIPVPNDVLIMAVFLVVINVLFIHLLKAPTQFGRKLLDQIEGFKLYLATAEQHRLDVMHPPEMTPELFEQYLPYAMALDVENQWSKNFALHVRSSISNRSNQAYHPEWYVGASISLGSHSRGFGALCEDMESILSEVTDPQAMDHGDEHLL